MQGHGATQNPSQPLRHESARDYHESYKAHQIEAENDQKRKKCESVMKPTSNLEIGVPIWFLSGVSMSREAASLHSSPLLLPMTYPLTLTLTLTLSLFLCLCLSNWGFRFCWRDEDSRSGKAGEHFLVGITPSLPRLLRSHKGVYYMCFFWRYQEK